jgi:hypothetical protein
MDEKSHGKEKKTTGDNLEDRKAGSVPKTTNQGQGS